MKFKLVEELFGVQKKEDIISKYDNTTKEALEELLSATYFNNIFFEDRNNTRYIKKNLAGRFISNGSINMSGEKFDTFDSLAAYAKIFRDSRFETFRIIYMKDDTVIGQDVVSSHLVDSTDVVSEKDRNIRNRDIEIYKAKMIRFNADGYVLMHNHPSGNVDASRGDIELSKYFANYINGFLGHLILGKDSWSLIDSNFEFHTLKYDDEESLNNIKINSKYKISELGQSYLNSDDYSLVFYVDNDHSMCAVQEIKNVEFNDKQIAGYLDNQRKLNGCKFVFVYTENLQVFCNCESLCNSGKIKDSIYFKKDSGSSYTGSEIYSSSQYDKWLIDNNIHESFHIGPYFCK